MMENLPQVSKTEFSVITIDDAKTSHVLGEFPLCFGCGSDLTVSEVVEMPAVGICF